MQRHYSGASAAEQLSMRYETDALLAAASTREVGVRVVHDLVWGEINCQDQFHRLQRRIEAARARGVQL